MLPLWDVAYGVGVVRTTSTCRFLGVSEVRRALLGSSFVRRSNFFEIYIRGPLFS